MKYLNIHIILGFIFLTFENLWLLLMFYSEIYGTKGLESTSSLVKQDKDFLFFLFTDQKICYAFIYFHYI